MTIKREQPILLFTGIIVSVTLLACIAYYLLYLNYDERLTVRITPDVIAINDFFSSVYLLRCDSGFIAFDAGFSETVIRRGLEYASIEPAAICVVLLTHSDLDHQRAIDVFPTSRRYMPEAEVEMIASEKKRFISIPFLRNFLIAKYDLLKDGDEITIGGRQIRCVNLPGHTSGSMGYIVDGKYLFSGDAFRIKNGRIALPYKKLFVMDEEAMRASIRKVARLDSLRYIFSANSGFTADPAFALQEWR
jgi:hydroxyacylglutathione hydrolase